MGFYESVGRETVFVGLKHYGGLLREDIFWSTVGHTFFFSGFTVVFHLLIGLGFALLLNRDIKCMSLWRALQFIPWLFPAAVASCIWKLIYQPQYGLLNTVLYGLNLSSLATEWLGRPETALAAVTVVNIWNWYPFLTLMLLAAMQGIPDELYEAAGIDGAGGWAKFFHITIPYLRPVILTVCLLDFIWTFRFFDMVWIMTRGGPMRASEILPSYVYKTAFEALNFHRAAAIGGLMVIFMVVFVVVYLLSHSSES
jgi:multiple sugar transport system permease protein